jgi:hypothetical protein
VKTIKIKKGNQDRRFFEKSVSTGNTNEYLEIILNEQSKLLITKNKVEVCMSFHLVILGQNLHINLCRPPRTARLIFKFKNINICMKYSNMVIIIDMQAL